MTEHTATPAKTLDLWPPLPGLLASAALALAATLVWQVTGKPALFSPMVLAMVAGIVLRNTTGLPETLSPGTALSMKPVLRLGIILLGFRLTLGDLIAVGPAGLAMIITVLFSTFFLVRFLGRLLGVGDKLSELIAAGTSVCGASAVLGVNTVTRGSDEDVAYAIACVTIFGSLSMLLFPAMMPLTGFDDHAFGLWTGSALHEVAQAVGAGFSVSDTAGETATIAKLTRVMLLAPLILGLGLVRNVEGGAQKAPIPWFVFGFLAIAALNSVITLPTELRSALLTASTFLLTMALGAMGMETHLKRLLHKGPRPLLLGAIGWIFIASAGALGTSLIR